ncbi:ammonium transporter family protein [Aureimonas frigidaquae]|uniref:Ammonium transporter n=1 Tax=Aureimonas frigidaquae TaxID=424757 RepID=A0A0P0YZX6_9HYPH|nr:ammonium transporter [Aureimonas frigidaquae]BAT27226.1 ammonium transporter [Aureimonas frigidaquae]
MTLSRIIHSAGLLALALPSLALAQDAGVEAAVAATPDPYFYVFNTVLFLLGGVLVMWMAAGFTMLEAGLVRSKNVSMQCLKNISLYSLGVLVYWLVGYNLMYTGVDGGWFGQFAPMVFPAPSADTGDYSLATDFFYQSMFCATAASIVSGTVAERVRLWPFLLFVLILCGIIYPITGSWAWGGGWLSQVGFSDFAGSTLVHSVGGWAALTGALIIGARKGRFTADGRSVVMPGSSIPLATLGAFILWFGWFGFNGASQLALGTIEDAASVGRVVVNTNTAAAAGVIVSMIVMQVVYKKVDVTMALNGALGGLVAITAEPLTPTFLSAAIIGGIGAALVVVAVPLLDKLKIDDVVGAIPVHLVAGIWGTLAVPFTNPEASVSAQLTGIVAVGAFTAIASAIVWLAIKAVFGLRPSEEEEALGLDRSEVGVEAYPEFSAARL